MKYYIETYNNNIMMYYDYDIIVDNCLKVIDPNLFELSTWSVDEINWIQLIEIEIIVEVRWTNIR